MTFQSTVASVQNIRKQRQLELELVELDRQWNIELKFIARERLGVLKELCRINQDMREVDHFRDSMHGKAITRFADRLHGRLQQERELKQIIHKFDFEPDPVEKMNLSDLLLRDEGEEGLGGAMEGEDLGKIWTSKDLNKQRVQLQKTTFDQSVAERRTRRRAFVDKAVLGRKKKNFQRDRNGFIRNMGGGDVGGGGAGGGGGPRLQVGMFGPPLETNGGSVTATTTTEGETETPETGEETPEHHDGVYEASGDGDPALHSEEINEAIAAAEALRPLAPHPPPQPREAEYDDDGPKKPYGPYKTPSLPALHNLRKIDTIKVRGRGRGRRRERIHPSLSDRNSASLDYLPLIKGTRPQHGVFTSQLESSNSKQDPVRGKTELSNGRTDSLSGRRELPNGKTESLNGKMEVSNGKAELYNSRTEPSNGRAESSNVKTESTNGRTAVLPAVSRPSPSLGLPTISEA